MITHTAAAVYSSHRSIFAAADYITPPTTVAGYHGKYLSSKSYHRPLINLKLC